MLFAAFGNEVRAKHEYNYATMQDRPCLLSVQRRLRVVALGRKNYLFVGHPRAGRNFAGLYSLVGSCVANDVEPTAYLADLLTRIGDAETDDEIDALLPDRWTPATDVKTG